MLYFLFGRGAENGKKEFTFKMNPDELEDLANFADALHGKFKMLVNELKLNKKDRRVKDVSDGFIVLCRKLNSLARKST